VKILEVKCHDYRTLSNGNFYIRSIRWNRLTHGYQFSSITYHEEGILLG